MVDSYLNLTRIQKEVPGVPDHEAWYLWHNHKVEMHFATLEEADEYCASNGIHVDVVEKDYT